ncbi:MAG: PEP/pyruvate-binding domain-containing protein [Polyangiales bacterium]
MRNKLLSATTLALLLCLAACSSDSAPDSAAAPIVEGQCQVTQGAAAPESLSRLGCTADFTALAAAALDADLPSARSTKVVLDTADGGKVYFQNSEKYSIHYDFVSTHLSGGTLPIVPQLGAFNSTEYYSPERRFILGAVTYYADPKVWALEIAPYDTASAEMIQRLFDGVKSAAFFGPGLTFHPTSESVNDEASKLPKSIGIKSTAELYAGTAYQPLTLGTTIGRLHFTTVANLANEYLRFDDVVVLDEAPNDISVVRGLITQEFQTPLSHVNVLSRNRRTPNMGLRDAMQNEQLRALDGKLVSLTVGSSEWSVSEATQAEADAFWQAHRPTPVTLPALNLEVTDLRDIEAVTPESNGVSLRDALKTAVDAFGGKAAHYSILTKTDDVPIRKAFAVPVYYYDQFMKQNGFFDRLDALLADTTFTTDAATRDAKLAEFRAAMQEAPVDAGFQALLKAKLETDYPGQRMRFRTSTNSEDLEGFPCAGCYESHTGDPSAWEDVLDAIRETWASIWLFRTFEERSYYGVDHKSVGMALLVHQHFPDEEANGVAITNNPYDQAGLEPAFFVNVQWGGDAEVVHPPAGIVSDQLLYYFDNPNQPITYLSHSNLVEDGETVLTNRQIHELGEALSAIHARFSPAYGPASGNTGWYAMDVEFKFDDDAAKGEAATLYVKQARPYPRSSDAE